MSDKTSLGDRMKNNYENRYRIKLTRRMPVIIRLDGKAFHTITRHCNKPFDYDFYAAMNQTAYQLCKEIEGTKCAYVQSDEISLLLTDFDKLQTQAWFDYNLQKIVSVSAAMASVYFCKYWSIFKQKIKTAFFDSRAFNTPKEEVCNYFVWRQKDWIRNSIQILAQAHYSHKELHKKSNSDMHEMLYEKGVNWANLESWWKNGSFIFKDGPCFGNSSDIIFTQNREAVEKYLIGEE